MYKRTLLIALSITSTTLYGASEGGMLAEANKLFCASKYKEAIPLYEQFLTTEPQRTDLHVANVNLAQCFIAQSIDAHHDNDTFAAIANMQAGWPLFESRIPLEVAAGKRTVLCNPLTADSPIAGRVIEIVAAGPDGFGDVCKFVPEYCPILQDMGAYVLLKLSAQHRLLAKLLSNTPGIDQIITQHTPEDEIPKSDYQISLMSLPGFFSSNAREATTPSTIPHLVKPGISVDPALVAHYKNLMSPDTLNIAICWYASPNPVAGGTRVINRNLPLEELIAVAAKLGYPIKLHSVQGPPTKFVTASQYKALQDTDNAAELAKINAEYDVIPDEYEQYITQVEDKAGPFIDTAAVIEACDGFAGCDTVFPNLAATMLKPTWFLLTKEADMRWGTKGDKTPWFQTATLLRQEKQGDWSAPLQRLAAIWQVLAHQKLVRS